MGFDITPNLCRLVITGNSLFQSLKWQDLCFEMGDALAAIPPRAQQLHCFAPVASKLDQLSLGLNRKEEDGGENKT